MNEKRTLWCVISFLVANCVVASQVASVRADEGTDAAIETAVGTVGEVLALGDLCDWNFSARVDKLFQDAAKALKLSAAQQGDIRARVTATRQATFGRFSTAGQERLRADICKPEERIRLETMIGRISFE